MLNARGCNATDGAVAAAAETAGRPVHAVLEDYLRKGGFQYARPPPPFQLPAPYYRTDRDGRFAVLIRQTRWSWSRRTAS